MAMVSTALLTSVGGAAPADTPAPADAPAAEETPPAETPNPLKPICHFTPGQPNGTYELLLVDATTAAVHLDEHQGDYLLEDAESCAVNPDSIGGTHSTAHRRTNG